MTMREKLREANRLARMRQGQDVPEDVALLTNPEIHFWQVPLLEWESQAGVVAAANLDVPDNMAGLNARNRVAIQSDVFHSLREPGNVDQKVFESVEDMVQELDPADIDHLADSLTLLMDYASPSVDGLTDEELNDLKKAFGETDWSELTGRQWAALKLCCQVLFPELLAVKLRGSSSTESSTPTSESAEST